MKKLLLVLLSVLLALGAAELGLRLYYGSKEPEDFREALRRAERTRPAPGGKLTLGEMVQASRFEDVVYELKPNLSGVFKGAPVRTSSQGLRGTREYSLEKPPGTFRIVGIGDSNMFGWGVGEGEPYLQILERRLNELSGGRRRFEVLNFGVPGYNTAIEVATFEHRALPFDPDLVVLHFIGNDFGLPYFMQPPEARQEAARSYLWQLLKARFGSSQDEVDPDLLGHDRSRLDPEYRAQVRGQYQHMLGVEGYKRAMARLGRLAREREIPVVVMALGDVGERGGLSRRVASANGLDFLNAAPRFYTYLVENRLGTEKQAWKKTFRIPRDGHPNPVAHRLYAEVLLADMARRGLAIDPQSYAK